MLHPVDENLFWHAVDPMVGKVQNNEPACVLPVAHPGPLSSSSSITTKAVKNPKSTLLVRGETIDVLF